MLPMLLVLCPLAWANEAPVALAGRAFLAYPGERIVLNGSESYDPDGDVLTYQWVQIGGPGTVLDKDDTPVPEFDARLPGTHSFELVVDDGQVASEPDVVDVIVVDPAVGESVEATGCSALPGAGRGSTGRGATVLGALGLALLGLARRRS